jgi:hypothetical protein
VESIFVEPVTVAPNVDTVPATASALTGMTVTATWLGPELLHPAKHIAPLISNNKAVVFNLRNLMNDFSPIRLRVGLSLPLLNPFFTRCLYSLLPLHA